MNPRLPGIFIHPHFLAILIAAHAAVIVAYLVVHPVVPHHPQRDLATHPVIVTPPTMGHTLMSGWTQR